MNQELVDRCLSYLEVIRVAPIQDGMQFDLETITEIAKKVSQNKDIRTLFATGNGLPMYFLCDVKCDRCDSVQTKELKKTQLISYIQLIRSNQVNGLKHDYQTVATCAICKDKEESEKKSSRIESQIAFSEMLIKEKDKNNTIILDNFLSSNARLNKGQKWVDAEKELRRRLNNCDHELIAEEIEEMEYSEFLRTPYWKIISFLVKKKNGFKCAMCNSKENLHVHHKSYDLHGYEHTKDGFDMLTTVCADCHSKHHEIES